MKYVKAMSFSARSPCTNIPLQCPLCLTGVPDEHKPAFWKYNFIHHITENHLDKSDELPTLPLDLILATHITQQEEEKLGIDAISTASWRDDHGIPDSDGIEAILEQSREQRKRAASELSQLSNTSRQPSPSKVQRRGPQ